MRTLSIERCWIDIDTRKKDEIKIKNITSSQWQISVRCQNYYVVFHTQIIYEAEHSAIVRFKPQKHYFEWVAI